MKPVLGVIEMGRQPARPLFFSLYKKRAAACATARLASVQV
jgi:hypothetical protein